MLPPGDRRVAQAQSSAARDDLRLGQFDRWGVVACTIPVAGVVAVSIRVSLGEIEVVLPRHAEDTGAIGTGGSAVGSTILVRTEESRTDNCGAAHAKSAERTVLSHNGAHTVASAGAGVELSGDCLVAALRRAIADRRGFLGAVVIGDVGVTVALLFPTRMTFAGHTQELAYAWALIQPMLMAGRSADRPATRSIRTG